MSGLFKPIDGIAGTAVDPIGPSGVLIDPITELTQPGGPYPAGYTLLTDGLGGWIIAPGTGSGINYQGLWDAATNAPALPTGSEVKGDYYIVSVAGSTPLGGITDWSVGDWAIYNGTVYQKIDNSDQVTSVFTRQGAVIALASDYDASQVDNDSSVTGAFVDNALDHLDTNKQETSEKGAANGYAPLDATGLLLTSDLPAATETAQGAAEIATQVETNAGADDTRIVTPAKLAGRTATETLTGIAEIATQPETDAGTDDTRIVTPAKLAGRTATETRTGIAEIATQVETDTGTDDTRVVTPLKLKSTSLAFTPKLHASTHQDGGTDEVATATPGANVIPKTAGDNYLPDGFIAPATETRRGTAEIATGTETNAGTDDTRIVTPAKLAGRTATETRTGIAEIATQVETDTGTDDTRIVTPAKLSGRAATETLTGIAEIATQPETDAGTDDTRIVTPAKLAGRTATETRTGIAEIATQVETDAGTDDTRIVTPLKLAGRTATETRTGIAEIATDAETNAGTDDTRIVTPLKQANYVFSENNVVAGRVFN
jgi:hypothetical protein